jgi:hypothetical protein
MARKRKRKDGVGQPGSAKEVAAYERVLCKVVEWLETHEGEVGLPGSIGRAVIIARELATGDGAVAISLALTHKDAIECVAVLDDSGAGLAVPHITMRLAECKPLELPVVVVLGDGGMFYHPLLRVNASARGSA